MSDTNQGDKAADKSSEEQKKPYTKPALKNHGNLRLISQMS